MDCDLNHSGSTAVLLPFRLLETLPGERDKALNPREAITRLPRPTQSSWKCDESRLDAGAVKGQEAQDWVPQRCGTGTSRNITHEVTKLRLQVMGRGHGPHAWLYPSAGGRL